MIKTTLFSLFATTNNTNTSIANVATTVNSINATVTNINNLLTKPAFTPLLNDGVNIPAGTTTPVTLFNAALDPVLLPIGVPTTVYLFNTTGTSQPGSYSVTRLGGDQYTVIASNAIATQRIFSFV